MIYRGGGGLLFLYFSITNWNWNLSTSVSCRKACQQQNRCKMSQMTGKLLICCHVTQTASLMALQAGFFCCICWRDFTCIPAHKYHSCRKVCHGLVLVCPLVSVCACRQRCVVSLHSVASCVCCRGHDPAHSHVWHLHGIPEHCYASKTTHRTCVDRHGQRNSMISTYQVAVF